MEGLSRPPSRDNHAERDSLLQALELLPAKQRAVVVLRYWADPSEARTAEVLGISVGRFGGRWARRSGRPPPRRSGSRRWCRACAHPGMGNVPARWCRRGDLNPHVLADTSPSSYRGEKFATCRDQDFCSEMALDQGEHCQRLVTLGHTV
ncbi:MAG: hypothetical protein KGQ66_21855 [Acidobacteriota bacterium]|nr:hypothetical protein [Acidobacteriota bacterium]